MAIYCADGERGQFSRRPPAPPPERRAGKEAWRPPDLEPDRCARCGALAMDHSTMKPEDR
jgi:hypothetical protein